MMRTLVALLAVSAASADVDKYCALDSARAVDDLMDSIVYIMASIYRCDGNDQVLCTMDVSATIQSVNKMVTIIVKSIDKCSVIETAKPECGIAISTLTTGLAGISSAAAGVVAKCPHEGNGGEVAATPELELAGSKKNKWGQCIVNIKDSVKSLFKSVKRALIVADNVHTDVEEAHNAVKLIDAFVGMGEYIAGAVAHCSVDATDIVNAGCAQMSARLTHEAGVVSVAATRMSEYCAPTEDERLYGLTAKVSAPANNGLTMGLTALLPITAVVAFVGGRRLAKVNTVQPAHDEEMLVQCEE